MKKRIFSLLMAICMVLSIMPMPAHAEEVTYYCGKTAHTHGDSCYSTVLICEAAEHQHGETCYEGQQALTCTLPEAHDHGEGCKDAEGNVICTKPLAHVHSEACTKEADAYTCGYAETHTHGEGCYTVSQQQICQTKEHTHDVVQCYTAETAETTCTLEVHTHEDACLTDPNGAAPASEDVPQEQTPVCTCEAACTAETMNSVCAICGAEGAGVEGCSKYVAPTEEGTEETPCAHEHDDSCGYASASEGAEEIPCAHEHDEGCGYVPATEGALKMPCTHEHTAECYPADSVSGNETTPSEAAEPTSCTHTEHTADCGYVPAVEGTPCAFECNHCNPAQDSGEATAEQTDPIAAVQALIDALPGADEITADNAEEVAAQLTAIDEARAALTDEEQAQAETQLDYTRYMAAAEALSALAGQAGAGAPMLTAEGNIDISTVTAPIEIDNTNLETYQNATLTGTRELVTADVTEEGEQSYDKVGGFIVVNGVTLNLTINNINISYGTFDSTAYTHIVSAIQLKNGATLNLTITGENTLLGHKGGAGINVPTGCTLTINGGGTLNATGGADETSVRNGYGGAGIGAVRQYADASTNYDSLGTIIINSGTINATGAGRLFGGAGIGGSGFATTGSITINGGIITAAGGVGAAGIGGGYGGYVENITITGGTVNANWGGSGYDVASALGAGYKGMDPAISCGTIAITGGNITANGNIGYGTTSCYSGGSVEISGNVVVACTGEIKADTVSGVADGYPVELTVYDGRLTDTISDAKITVGSTAYPITLTVDSNHPYVGTFNATLYSSTAFTGEQTITITGGSNTWTTTATLTRNTTNTITIGEQLYPVDLLFFDESITTDISGCTLTATQGDNTLTSAALVYENTIKYVSTSAGKMTVYMPAGESTISVMASGLNSNAKIDETATITAGTNNVVMWNTIGAFVEGLDLSKGPITFADDGNGKLTITYYTEENGTQQTAADQLYSMVYKIVQSDPETATGNTITITGKANSDVKTINILLNGINVSAADSSNPISITNADVKLLLAANNTLKTSESSEAAIYVVTTSSNCASLTIEDDADTDGIGELTADATNGGAAIGNAGKWNASTNAFLSFALNSGLLRAYASNPNGVFGYNMSDLIINGGTFIKSGVMFSYTGGSATKTLAVTGGTMFNLSNSVVEYKYTDYYNGNNTNLFKTALRGGATLYRTVIKGLSANTAVSATEITVNETVQNYNFTDVLTDGDGNLYLFLPKGEASVTIDGKTYTGKITTEGESVFELTLPIPLTANTSSMTPATATINATTDAGATVYYVASITAITDGATLATSQGVQNVTADANGTAAINLTGLTKNTAYTYYLTASVGGSYSDVVKVEFTTLDKVEVAISGVSVANKTYDGSPATYDATGLTAITGGQTVDIGTPVYTWYKADGTALTEAPTDAGSYKLEVSVSDSNEKYIGSYAITFSITQAALTPVIVDAATQGTPTEPVTKVYDGTAGVAYSLLTIKLDGVVGQDDVSLAATFTYNSKDVAYASTIYATLDSSLTGTDSGNYTLSESFYVLSVPGRITQRELTPSIKLTSNTKVYDGSASVPDSMGASIVLDGAASGEDPTATATFAYNSANVASAGNITASGIKLDGHWDGNYVLTAETAEISADITPRTVNATVVVTPDSYVYTGRAITPTEIAVLDGGNTIPEREYMIEYSGNTDAGTATVTITDKDGGNYTVSGSAIFRISPAQLTDVSVTQNGTLTYTGYAQTPTVSASATTVDGADVTFTYCATENGTYTAELPAFTNAGTYTVYFKASVANHDDYGSSFNVVIGKQELTPAIQLTASSKTYDGTTAVYGASITLTGAVYGEEPTATATFAYNSANVAEAEKVTATGIALDGTWGNNYALTVNTLEIAATITKAGQTAPAENEGYTIDYATETITVTSGYEIVTALTDGETVAGGAVVTPGTTIYIRKIEKANYNSSDWTAITVASRPAAPQGVTAADETVLGLSDGRISGITADMEYKIGNGTWTTGDGKDITGLVGGTTVLVRFPATATAPHGEELTITIKAGAGLTVTFDSKGGSTVAAATGISYDTTIAAPTAPTKDGYTFGGWYTDEACTTAYDFTAKVTTCFILYAKWTVAEYTITYHLNGGTNPAGTATTYTVESAAITLSTPTKAIHVFDGWYLESTFQTKVTEIPAGSTGDKVFYAKWTQVDYEIIHGDEQVVTKGNAVTFTSDADFSKFVRVEVDGQTIASDNYTVVSGSTTKVTLKAAYIETLSVGEHTLTIVFADGTASTTFTVKNASNPDVPGTGDNEVPGLWISLFVLSASGAFAALVVKRKKGQYQR